MKRQVTITRAPASHIAIPNKAADRWRSLESERRPEPDIDFLYNPARRTGYGRERGGAEDDLSPD